MKHLLCDTWLAMILCLGIILAGCSLTGLYKNAKEELSGEIHVGDFGGNSVDTTESSNTNGMNMDVTKE